jgi:4-hydroxybenzoyl-CoA thioesterase
VVECQGIVEHGAGAPLRRAMQNWSRAMMSIFQSEKLIRFHHCDPAGIVFYPQYFVLFHELLEDWFNRGLGVNYADFVSKERRGLPTAHIDCDFRAPSKIGETVQLRLAVKRIGNSSVTLAVAVHGGDTLRVTANQVLVLISLQDGTVLAIPEDLKRRFARFMDQADVAARRV